ncbi:MAG: hypothetical protein ACO1SX_07400 [Actinomycetota bacterium]
MNRICLIAGSVLGLLLLSTPARAVTLTATPGNPLASGSYSVNVVPQGGNVFAFTVSGNPDGRTTASGGPVKHTAVEISIGFLRGDFSAIAPDGSGSSGGTTSGGSFVGASWSTAAESGALHFDSTGALHDLDPFGANSFSGTVKLASADVAELVAVTLHGGTQQWATQGVLPRDVSAAALGPEPGSLALAAPGLLPLLFLRRRRRE